MLKKLQVHTKQIPNLEHVKYIKAVNHLERIY